MKEHSICVKVVPNSRFLIYIPNINPNPNSNTNQNLDQESVIFQVADFANKYLNSKTFRLYIRVQFLQLL